MRRTLRGAASTSPQTTTATADVCEHKWTIVYLGDTPVGISCENCQEAMALDKSAPRDGSVEWYLDYSRLVTVRDQGQFRITHYSVDRSLREPKRISVELTEEIPFEEIPF